MARERKMEVAEANNDVEMEEQALVEELQVKQAADSGPTPSSSLNFSRKRVSQTPHYGGEHGHDNEADNDNPSQTPSKRHRSSNWPLGLHDNHESGTPYGSTQKRHASGPSRFSKFKEGSMNDKPSDKPPSAFTRIFGHSKDKTDLNVDHLMEDYMATVAEGSASGSNSSNGGSTEKIPPKHAPSTDVRQEAQSVHSAGVESQAKIPGGFKLGRFASAFNPMNIWGKMTKSWTEVKEEAEKVDAERTQQQKTMDHTRQDYEAKYQELKKAGLLGQLGSNTISGTVFTEGYTTPAALKVKPEPAPYDSGIDMTDRSNRPSTESSNPSTHQSINYATTAGDSRRPKTPKSISNFFRSPSIGNLRKAKSEVDLGVHESRSRSVSPEKQPYDAKTLRKSQSKKELIKQQKLNKRVSDLEAKLQEARRELRTAVGEATSPVPPVPALPRELPPVPTLPAKTQKKFRSMSPSKKHFVPGRLETVMSERLLDPAVLAELGGEGYEISESAVQTSGAEKARAEALKMMAARELGPEITIEPPTSDILGSQPDVAELEDTSVLQPKSGNSSKHKKDSVRKTATKKRKSLSKDDIAYKPSNSDDDDEDENEIPKNVTPRKRHHADRSKKSVAVPPRSSSLYDHKQNSSSLELALQTQPLAQEEEVLLRPSSLYNLRNSASLDLSLHAQPITPTEVAPPVLEERIVTTTMTTSVLETVDEDAPLSTATATTITKIALNGEPINPTAIATPAHPSSGSRAGSPSKDQPNKLRISRRSQSQDRIGSPRRTLKKENSMPSNMGNGEEKKGPRESFEWPEDVF